MTQIGIIGTTSWGTTLGILLAKKGIAVKLWARTKNEAATLEHDRQNLRLIPGVRFPETMSITADPAEAFGEANLVVIAVPSAHLRRNLRIAQDQIPRHITVLSATKGLERDTGKRMSEIFLEELLPEQLDRFCVLSGPNLSREISQGKPSSTVIASKDSETRFWVQGLFNSTAFRVYTSDDPVGVELGGALKNVIAIGSGVSDGLGYGDNAKAALITRGLAEITRLGVELGASPLTFAGLAGLGDLVATCFSPFSRNRYVGEQLGAGRRLSDILASMKHTVEGIDASAAAIQLANHQRIEMPILNTVNHILHETMTPTEAAELLLARPPGDEWPITLMS